MIDSTGLKADGVFNSKENISTINYFCKLLSNGYMSKVPIDHLFESGRAAFKFDGAWEVNTVYTSYKELNLGVAPYITSDNWNGERYRFMGICGIVKDKKYRGCYGTCKMDERS